ncbi:MAG: UbiD family decarboxylase [Nocardioidaceae bacterium]
MSAPEQTPDGSRLEDHLAGLDAGGLLRRVRQEVSIHEIGAIVAECPQAVLFESVRGYDLQVGANLLATRACWATVLGVAPGDVREEVTRRLGRRIAPVVVPTSGLHDVVLTGDSVDVTALPAYLQHEEDGGPYISAALDVSNSPSTGQVNLGVRRLMLRSRDETGVDIVAPSDLRAYYTQARDRGQRFEVAFVVGGHPMDYLASQLKVGAVDDWELAGGLRGSAVPLVRCRSIGLLVPADADLVLEGHLTGDWSEVEGPYGEYHGCLGPPHRNPVFKVTAVTHRQGGVFQSMTIGNPALGHTDTAMIAAMKSELMVWAALERSVAVPLDVYCPPSAGGRHHVRLRIRHRDPGDPRNALLAALSCQADLKMATVVDEDIDIRDDGAVEWAMSTRYQADRDTLVLEGLRTLPLEPSLDRQRPGGVVTSKLGLDATRRRDVDLGSFAATRTLDPAALKPATLQAEPVGDAPVDRLEETLASPRSFAEIVSLLDGVHQRDLLAALGSLRAARALHVDGTGRYSVRQPPP